LKPGYRRPTPEPDLRTPSPLKEKVQETQLEGKSERTGPPASIDPNTKFIEYQVRAADDLDLWNVAATYGVRVEDIRRYNRRVVFDYLDNVIGETIYIPINVQEGDHIPKQPESDPKKILEFKFVAETGTGHAEAKYYLEEANWEYNEAIKSYHEDINWERSQESKEKAKNLENVKNGTGTPTEKLVAVLSPPTTIVTTSESSISINSSSTVGFPPPSYSFEGVNNSVSMQSFPPSAPPTYQHQTQIQSLQQPLLQNQYES